jgi:hypothetical protein
MCLHIFPVPPPSPGLARIYVCETLRIRSTSMLNALVVKVVIIIIVTYYKRRYRYDKHWWRQSPVAVSQKLNQNVQIQLYGSGSNLLYNTGFTRLP